ncbi:MAG: toll/interleukin-1 receptor domain-containing protein [Polyangiaceae bacterium]
MYVEHSIRCAEVSITSLQRQVLNTLEEEMKKEPAEPAHGSDGHRRSAQRPSAAALAPGVRSSCARWVDVEAIAIVTALRSHPARSESKEDALPSTDDSRSSRVRVLLRHSSSAADLPFVEELLRHLRTLQRFRAIEVWADDQIAPGMELRQQIDLAIDNSDVVLLALSPDLLDLESFHSVELERILDRARAGDVTVIPLIIRACLWAESPQLKLLKPLPKGGRSLASFPSTELDGAMASLIRDLSATILRQGPAVSSTVAYEAKRRRLPVRLIVPLGLGLLGLAVVVNQIATPGRTRNDIGPDKTNADQPCGPGRQRHNGRCVSDQIIDFLTCLEGCTAAAARLLLRKQPPPAANVSDDQLDEQMRQLLDDELSRLPADDFNAIMQTCRDAAKKAGLSVTPVAVPSAKSSAKTAPSPVIEKTDESKALPADKAYLTVQTSDEFTVYVTGKEKGLTNHRLEVPCGVGMVRVGRPSSNGDAEWHSALSPSISIPCRSSVTIAITASAGPWPAEPMPRGGNPY